MHAARKMSYNEFQISAWYPSGLRERSAKPLFAGSNPAHAYRFVKKIAALVLFCALGNAWGAGSSTIQNGSTVKFLYVLTVEGKVADKSVNRVPMTYVQGAGQIVPGLEEGLKGAKAGDKKHVRVPPGKGYGHIDADLMQKIPKKSIKNGSKLKIGDKVNGQIQGREVKAVIAGSDTKHFYLDLNHPLAGKTLEFDIEVIEVK